MEQALLPRVKSRVTIEMLGSPKAHIEKTLKDYVAKLGKDKTVQILKEHYSPAQERDGLFAIFVELEMWFKDVHHLLAFCFDAMPSTVEIMEPRELHIDAGEFQNFLNDMQARLHTVDLALKELKATLRIVDKNAINALNNFTIHLVKQGQQNAETLSKIIGIPAQALQAYLDKLVAEGRIKKEGTHYVA